MDDLRCGIGDELWINLPKEQREKIRKSTGDVIAPCGKVGFKLNISRCADKIHPVMCAACKGAR